MCLNPSFSGIWPVAGKTKIIKGGDARGVLILLLVEYGLWQKNKK